MSRIKKLVITSTVLTLLASGITYSLCKKNNSSNKYLSKYQIEETDDLLMCAHRGFSSMEVENTYKALSLAADTYYIDCIEIDARMTKDGKIVLSHDNILMNKNKIPTKVSNLTYDEAIKTEFVYQSYNSPTFFWYDDEQIMVNNRFNGLSNQIFHLISLPDGIKACGDKTIIVDLKFNNDFKDFTLELKKEVVDSSNLIFQSFDAEALKYLQSNTDFKCILLVDSKSDLKYLNDFSGFAIKKSLITYDLVKELINQGKKVAVWTVNSTKDINSLLDEVGEYYQDIIYITDYPDLILTRINEYKQTKNKSLITRKGIYA